MLGVLVPRDGPGGPPAASTALTRNREARGPLRATRSPPDPRERNPNTDQVGTDRQERPLRPALSSSWPQTGHQEGPRPGARGLASPGASTDIPSTSQGYGLVLDFGVQGTPPADRSQHPTHPGPSQLRCPRSLSPQPALYLRLRAPAMPHPCTQPGSEDWPHPWQMLPAPDCRAQPRAPSTCRLRCSCWAYGAQGRPGPSRCLGNTGPVLRI